MQARADGFNHPFTSPVVVGALAVAALSGAGIGLVLRRHAPVPGRLVVAAAGAIAVYLVLMTGAGLATADRHVGTLEPTVVRLAMLGHVPVLTLFPLTAIAMARFLDPASAALRHWGSGFLLLSVANAVTSFVLVPPWEPFDRVGPVGSASSAVVAMCEVLNVGWLAGMVLGPLLLGRRARALRATPDDRAARLATAAVASLVPVCLVVLCTVLGVASAAGGLGENVGIALLLVAMCLAWPMTACGFVLAARPAQGPDPVGWAFLGRSASLLLGLLSGMVAVGSVLVTGLGRGPVSAFWAGVFALAVAGALRPLARRFHTGLVGDLSQPPDALVCSASWPELLRNRASRAGS